MSRFTTHPAGFRCTGFIFSLSGSSFGIMGGTAVVAQGIYASLLFLPSMLPDLILGMAFYSLEEGGTNQCNVVPYPIVWDFGRMVRAHHFAPQHARDPGCRELYCQRIEQPHPRRPSLLVLCGPCIFHHCSRIHTATCGHTVGPHVLGCPAPCGCCG